MGEFIDEEHFYKWAMPCMSRIARELRLKHPSVPLLVFPRGAGYAITTLQAAGYDVITLGTKADRIASREALTAAANHVLPPRGSVSGLQGNLDVALLRRDGSSEEMVRTEVRKMLVEFGPQNLIANLGEGLLGKEDPALVNTFIDAVHEISEEIIKSEKK